MVAILIIALSSVSFAQTTNVQSYRENFFNKVKAATLNVDAGGVTLRSPDAAVTTTNAAATPSAPTQNLIRQN